MEENAKSQPPLPAPFIAQRADPYILHHTDGLYYFTASVPQYDRIILRRSATLLGLRDATETTVWRKHSAGEMSIHIWAPELHYLEGCWYLYFAAGKTKDKWHIRPYILQCLGSDPLAGEWRELGMPKRNDVFSFNEFSLDMTVFPHNGRRFAVWAEKVNIGNRISNLYIAEMDKPDTLKTAQVLLSAPNYAWERIGFWVNEGPAFLYKDSKIYLTFSASETGACYCMGLLWADAGADLLDAESWHKLRQPILETNRTIGLFGPGHNSFFHDESGETIMAFHARPYEKIEGDPLYDPNRHTYLMHVHWKDGYPVLDYQNLLEFAH